MIKITSLPNVAESALSSALESGSDRNEGIC